MRRKRKERFNEYVSGSGSVDSTEAGRLTSGPGALDHKSIIEELRMQRGTGLLCLHFHDQLCMVLPGPASFLSLPAAHAWPVASAAAGGRSPMLGRQTGTRPTDGKRHWLLRGRATNIFDAKEERRAGISVERRTERKGAGRPEIGERGGIRPEIRVQQ